MDAADQQNPEVNSVRAVSNSVSASAQLCIPVSSSWINPFLRQHQDQLVTPFLQGSISVLAAHKVHHAFVKFLKLRLSDYAFKAFSKALHTQYSEFAVDFAGFIQLIEHWADQHQDSLLSATLHVCQTLTEFKQLQEGCLPASYEPLNDLVRSIDVLASRLTTAEEYVRMLAAEQQGLHEIFSFYARRTVSFGPKATFEQIQQNNCTWSLAKFLKFLSDFALVKEQARAKREAYISVFKSTAINSRVMEFAQFLEALDLVGDYFFSGHLCKTVRDKRQTLYTYLGIYNLQYKKKLCGPSKSKLQKRLSAAVQEKLAAWKKQRSVSKSTSIRTVSSQNITVKPLRYSMLKGAGYASRYCSAKALQLRERRTTASPVLAAAKAVTSTVLAPTSTTDELLHQLYGPLRVEHTRTRSMPSFC